MTVEDGDNEQPEIPADLMLANEFVGRTNEELDKCAELILAQITRLIDLIKTLAQRDQNEKYDAAVLVYEARWHANLSRKNWIRSLTWLNAVREQRGLSHVMTPSQSGEDVS